MPEPSFDQVASERAHDVSLLKTKLYIPPTRPELVSRPRLIERLVANLGRKLTLVSAPAGFGKTTLLGEFFASCSPNIQIAWLSLDSSDSDPVRFWSYLIAALQNFDARIGQALLAMLRSPGLAGATARPPIETLLAGLINDLSEYPSTAASQDTSLSRPYILVLDDYHLIAEPQIHEGLTFLLDNLPPRVHLVVSGRTDPPWPLARLRARRELTEIRAPDLRFTAQEAAAFLNESMGLGLSPGDVAALKTRTEGWITGLQMAALALQGIASQGAPAARQPEHGQRTHNISRFVRAFTGSHRFVLDYLVEEVLEQQSPVIREFLLRTSILERLTGPLCDAVLAPDPPASTSQETLAKLDGANLFLFPLDDERRWYRYHTLFADLLRNQLEITHPRLSPTLHRRASQWYEDNGLIAGAVSHALAGNDIERVARLVEGNALRMVAHGELSTLREWLSALPQEIVSARPWLSLAYAWVLVFSGQFNAAEPLLRDTESALGPELVPAALARDDSDPADSAQGPALSSAEGPALSPAEGPAPDRAQAQQQWGHLDSIRAYIAFLSGDWIRAADLALDAQLHLPKSDLMARGYVKSLLGVVLRSVGELEAAAQTTADAIAISEQAGDSHVTMLALGDLAALQTVQGKLHEAFATAEELLRRAGAYVSQGGRRLPVAGRALSRMGRLQLEWNDLEAALRCARQGVELCKQWGWADFTATAHQILARALWAAGDPGSAWEAMREAATIARSISPRYQAGVAASMAHLHVRAGDIASASRWVRDSGISAEDDFKSDDHPQYLTLARVLLAEGELDEALELLSRMLSLAETAGAAHHLIETLVVQALTLEAKGQGDLALSALERALHLAEPHGYVRVFVDEGPPLDKLLGQIATGWTVSDYVTKLGAALQAEIGDGRGSTRSSSLPRTAASLPALVEPLSPRELEVLQLLSTNLSTSEMADRLVVSVHTVRSHIKSIYGKLGVHSRMMAVVRAGELGLL